MSAPDVATEIVADVAEEVADQATHIAEMSRGLSGRNLGMAFGGFVVGAGLGGTLGYILCRRKLETKYNQFAADEIAEMRQHYHAKTVALENSVDKPRLDELVRDQGYSIESATPPMAVTPPTAVVEAAKDIAEVEDEMAGEPPEPETIDDRLEPEVRNIFREAEVQDNWDFHKERARRSPLRPYVIHRDEREEEHAYDSVTFTYYEEDDVLCNEADEVIDEEDRERLIGESNLGRFGHGSGDASIVYIRNNQLEMDFEVIRSPNSYAEEVHGFEPEIKHAHRYRGRRAFDDE